MSFNASFEPTRARALLNNYMRSCIWVLLAADWKLFAMNNYTKYCDTLLLSAGSLGYKRCMNAAAPHTETRESSRRYEVASGCVLSTACAGIPDRTEIGVYDQTLRERFTFPSIQIPSAIAYDHVNISLRYLDHKTSIYSCTRLFRIQLQNTVWSQYLHEIPKFVSSQFSPRTTYQTFNDVSMNGQFCMRPISEKANTFCAGGSF